MIALPKYRPIYALSVALIFLISGILPLSDLVSTINWNVLLMISGTMIIVYYFIKLLVPLGLILKKLVTFCLYRV
ncbi:MAG: hypothetical protein J6P72_04325 [Firmicutes bacterium]|nr:hypothetical protein [Bacillota bacterium]